MIRWRLVAAEHLAHRRDGVGEISFLDERVGPDRSHQRVFGHQPAMVLHQHAQRVERLAPKGEGTAPAGETTLVDVEHEGTEFVDQDAQDTAVIKVS